MGSKLHSILEGTGYERLEDELEKVALIQNIFSQKFPFENVDVLLQNEEPITETFLFDKMVRKQRGGLCYELNGLLYLLLKELKFDVDLVAGTMRKDEGWAIEGTHAVVLLKEGRQLYVVDGGAGSQLALQPLPLDGESVQSQTGKYRLRTKRTEKGTMVTERFIDGVWKLWYAIAPDPVGMTELTHMKQQIHHHPKSPFSGQLLFAKVVVDGTLSINEERFHRKWADGREQTIPFHTDKDMLEQIMKHGSNDIYQTAKAYVQLKN